MQQMHHLHPGKKPAWLSARWKRLIDKAIYAVAVFAPFSYAPQTYKLFAERDAGSLSISTFLLLFVINALWFVYGVAHRSKPLIITSILFCAFHVIIIAGILLF